MFQFFHRHKIPVEISSRGEEAVPVILKDHTTDILTVPFLKERTSVTLAVDTIIDDRDITLEAGHSAVVGEIVELAKFGTDVFMQSAITAVNVNVITLDQPVNNVYLTTDTAIVSSNALNVDGSITPQIFSILPGPTQRGHITRIIIEMRGTLDMSFSTFGSIAPALTNGCVLRIKRADGTFTNLFNFKSNGDFIEQSYDHTFFPNNGQGIRGFTARLTWAGQGKHGSAIPLDGALGEELQVVIQDPLNVVAMARLHLIGQGHTVPR